MVGESQEAVGAAAGGGGSSGSNKLPTLEEYGTNLTTKAEEVCAHQNSWHTSLVALLLMPVVTYFVTHLVVELCVVRCNASYDSCI